MKPYLLEDKEKRELIDLILDKDKRLKEIEAENKRLKKELCKYKNENTPSSSNKHLKPNTQGLRHRQGSRRGAPKGHKGTTRQSSPTSHEVVDADCCPCCDSSNVSDEKILKRVVTEVPEPIIPEDKSIDVHIKKCRDCGLRFVPKHNTTPLKGRFGINLMVLVIFIKFILRGVLRKTANFLDFGFAFKITPASVNAIIKRAAEAAESEYEALKIRIRKRFVHNTSGSKAIR